MKIRDIIAEAHHTNIQTKHIGAWPRVDLDSHALLRHIERGASPEDFWNIILYACHDRSILERIYIGRGAFVKDQNTGYAVYIRRLGQDHLRLETMLDSDMHTKGFTIELNVPRHNQKTDPKMAAMLKDFAQEIKKRGIDDVSQDLEIVTAIKNMNREERRAFNRQLKKMKISPIPSLGHTDKTYVKPPPTEA